MPRIGAMPEQQSSGGQFRFAEGRGVVVNCVIANEEIPGYATSCGWKLFIQRLTPDGKPTNDEPVAEFLAAGNVEVFHPGMASGPDDNDPQLEINGSKDMGTADEAEGNCLLTIGRGPDRQSKSVRFANSAIAQGVKKEVFDGWAANLIGLDAHFTQMLLQKPKNSTAKEDPTCLIIGKGGKEVPAEKLVYKYPDGTGVSQFSGTATASSSRPAPTPITTARATPPPPPADANGANAAPVNGAPAVNAAPPAEAAPAGPVEDDKTVATKMLQIVGADLVGKAALTRKKIGARVMSKLADARIPTARHATIMDLIKKDDAFFQEFIDSDERDWAVVGSGETATVTVTA